MAREQRRLAAILAADAVGYSRLMGRDEAGTLARLKAHRTEWFEPALARNGGRVVKLVGDGALAEFGSAVDALRAAVEFQQAMIEANRDQPQEERIVFRVGLHLGDLIVDGDDLYGDGVNVASRLEAEAPAGGVVISHSVHDAVAGRLKATFKNLGELPLKNIDRPVRAFGVQWDATDWKVMEATTPSPSVRRPAEVPLTLPDKPSIAVLPFQNISGDLEQEYFVDGLVEDITTELSRFKSLFVISRNSAFTYKGRAVDTKQVGRELGVRYVLEGSIRRASNRVRVTGQLIECETGLHLWADRFDGRLEAVFELQEQLAASVVGAIAPKLDQAEIERVKRKSGDSLVAYDCYLRGLSLSYAMTKEAQEQALKFFYRAIELDPSFSAPYGMAARCYWTRKVQGWMVDGEGEIAETKRLSLQVPLVGHDDPLALSRAGFALFYVCGAHDSGRTLADQALSITESLSVCWTNRGWISVFLGEHERAMEDIHRTLRLSPLDPENYRPQSALAFAHLFLGRYDDALACAAKVRAQRPNWLIGMLTDAAAHALRNDIEGTAVTMATVRDFYPDLRVSDLNDILPLQRKRDTELLAESLRLAGLPQ